LTRSGCEPKYAGYFPWCQVPVPADRQTFTRQESYSNASKFHYRMPDGFEHLADLTVFSLRQRHLIPAVYAFTQHHDPATSQLYTVFQPNSFT
jgi:hypothetical protein